MLVFTAAASEHLLYKFCSLFKFRLDCLAVFTPWRVEFHLKKKVSYKDAVKIESQCTAVVRDALFSLINDFFNLMIPLEVGELGGPGRSPCFARK